MTQPPMNDEETREQLVQHGERKAFMLCTQLPKFLLDNAQVELKEARDEQKDLDDDPNE